MLKSKKIAVTGGISCGKSLLCTYLKELGAYVVSADKIVHQLLSPDSTLGKKVVQLLGPTIVEHGKFNREKIAELVFAERTLLKQLEKILHPEVFREIEQLYISHCAKGEYPLFVAEIPLLFEVHAEKLFDVTVALLSKKELCIDRFVKSKKLSREEYSRRMEMQLAPEKKAELADIVCYNDGSSEELKSCAEKLFIQLSP